MKWKDYIYIWIRKFFFLHATKFIFPHLDSSCFKGSSSVKALQIDIKIRVKSFVERMGGEIGQAATSIFALLNTILVFLVHDRNASLANSRSSSIEIYAKY